MADIIVKTIAAPKKVVVNAAIIRKENNRETTDIIVAPIIISLAADSEQFPAILKIDTKIPRMAE